MELFLKIYDYNNYEVSNHGRVRSLKTNTILKQQYGGKNGKYKTVNLVNNKGLSKRFYVHRLVANLFVSNPFNYKQVNHKDGDTNNNHYANLNWVTAKQNINHSYLIGTSKLAENRHNSKLSNSQVVDIRKRILFGFTNSEIAKFYNVSCDIIRSIKNGKCYKSVE